MSDEESQRVAAMMAAESRSRRVIASEKQCWIVICRGDREGLRAANYQLATRTMFRTHDLAVSYARTIAKSRKAIVVLCPLGVELRDDAEERFG
jgi:hypothetical protein